jgi:ATP-dependent helicase/nuclease subunit A
MHGGDHRHRIDVQILSLDEVVEDSAEPRQTPADEQFNRIAHLQSIDAKPLPEAWLDALLKPYPFEALSTSPATMAVTMMTKRQPLDSPTSGDEPAVSRVPGLPQMIRLQEPRFLAPTTEVGSVDIGSATHTFLEHLDFSRAESITEIQAQVQEQVQRNFLTPTEAELVDLEGIEWFCNSVIGKQLRADHSMIQREVPFAYAIDPPIDGLPLSADDRTVVRGRIDLMITPPVGPIIIDYKTDRIPKEILKARIDLYRPQIAIYAHAIAAIYNQPVKRACLVFLHLRELVEFEPK